MTGLIIALAALLAIALLRLSLTVQYGEDGALVYARVGPKKIALYPGPEKRRDKPEREKKKEEKPDRGGTLEGLRAGLELAGPIMGRVRRRLLVRRLTLHYTAAAEDAAETAMAYGAASAAVAVLVPALSYNFRVKEQDIQIHVDFEHPGHKVFFQLRLSIAVWEILYLAAAIGRLLLKSGLVGGGKKESGAEAPQTTA